MTVLVTGGSGLVGARLLPRLVEAGVDCRALMRGRKKVPAGVTAVDGVPSRSRRRAMTDDSPLADNLNFQQTAIVYYS